MSWRVPTALRERPGLISVVRILLLFESSLYSAVTPVLPHYAHVLGVGKPAVGVLAAAYSAGLIPGSLLGGWLAKRTGVRRTTLTGLIAFALAVAAFGFATSIVTLDALRFVQGVACGGIWGGALTWVIAIAPRERRGALIGSVIGAATFGTLLGPLLGTLAVAAGTQTVFSLVGAVSLGLALWVRTYPEPSSRTALRTTPGDGAPHRRPRLTAALLLGTWLIALEAMTYGAINALLPLRLSSLGAPALVIGATFLAAAALGTLLSPLIGRATDRRGPRPLLTGGIVISALLLPTLALSHSYVLLAVMCVITLGGPLTAYMTPAVSVMTESAERTGIAIVLVTTLFNLAYASGETIGAPVAAVLSQATTDTVPLSIIGLLMLLTIIPARRIVAATARATPPSQPDSDEPCQPSTGSSVTSRETRAA
jgi:MFS family permease